LLRSTGGAQAVDFSLIDSSPGSFLIEASDIADVDAPGTERLPVTAPLAQAPYPATG
jgi:hypothetical protein